MTANSSEIPNEPSEKPQGYFLTGKYVGLRPFLKEDLDGPWYSWFNDPEVTQYLQRGSFPNTPEAQARFFEHIQACYERQDQLILALVDVKTKKHVGVMSLRPIDWINRTADIAIIIGEKESRSSFHAIEGMALLTDHAFTRLQLHKLKATQHEGLANWVKYLEILGYFTEGVFRKELFTEGRYHDVFHTAIFAEDFLKLKAERGGNILGKSIKDLLREQRAKKSDKHAAAAR